MTQAAKQFGKFLPHFLRSTETKSYLEDIARTARFAGLEMVKVVPGNRYVADRGTWGHPELAVFFARWLDVRFAVASTYICLLARTLACLPSCDKERGHRPRQVYSELSMPRERLDWP